ncbi:MAG: class I SAM-dependent methyltransferase [Candidatus Eisenbacteria sp.]|nr:class I SAM-dependent methyltransferase [Candidatus Eisenbacteria bacterium]
MSRVRGRILDVGCGAGRSMLYLQQKGRAVTGIDISPLAIEVCRRRHLSRKHAAMRSSGLTAPYARIHLNPQTHQSQLPADWARSCMLRSSVC